MPYRTPKKLSALHGLTRTFLKSIMLTIVAMGALATISPAAELPVAPGSIVRLDAAVTAARASASMPRIAETNTLDRKLDKKLSVWRLSLRPAPSPILTPRYSLEKIGSPARRASAMKRLIPPTCMGLTQRWRAPTPSLRQRAQARS